MALFPTLRRGRGGGGGAGFLTNIQRCVLLRGEIIDVGDAEGLDGGLPNPTQDVPQEHVDPHGQVGLALAPCGRANGSPSASGKRVSRVLPRADSHLCQALRPPDRRRSSLPTSRAKGSPWS